MPRQRGATGAARPTRNSVGLLLFRGDTVLRGDRRLEVLLAHPGGPFWAWRDGGVWSLPKGEGGAGEDDRTVAAREFEEETGHRPPAGPWIELGSVVQKAGKRVVAFAAEGDLDPAMCHSNEVSVEWPPRSGRQQVIPEVDRVAWFTPDEARRRLNPAQAPFIDRLEAALAERSGGPSEGRGSRFAPELVADQGNR
ncbi:MAG TPA: NUDIX domain-containing protein [Candidatus Limnocylindrales bacterium]|jgi:predicted NUDIX family NTP pyrophosphohydrolase|nr:NUDIX domain-containing protein [Candidatus Limnocylindrales bacterium]